MCDYFGKRAGDLFFSIISLLVLLPIFFLIAILIKIFDNGPIFFTQYRVGKGNKKFIFIKFRSLPASTPNIPSDKLGKVKISFIGRIIRRTNADELPQLINILKGDMSFVGPRPALDSQRELIDARTKNGSINCRPGLTGLAQVNSYNNMPFEEKAKFDYTYCQNISLISDISIILKTFIYLLSPPPIY